MSTTIYPWQRDSWSQIAGQITKRVLPHAYLFNGVQGIGKLDFARYLANYLLCENGHYQGGQAEEPCGECKQCRLVLSGTHSDLKVIEPEEGSKVIKVDVMRDLTHFISQSSNQGGLKIAILNPAEALNINAANALLKTLEEPAPKSLIILVSHVSGQLLPTIRSRCQIVDFAKPVRQDAESWVASKLGKDGDIDVLLELAAGAPLEALRLGELDVIQEREKMLVELGAVLKREVSPSAIAERWSDDLSELRLNWLILWLQKITSAKLSNTLDEVLGSNKMFAYIGNKATSDKLFSLYDQSLAQQRLLIGSSNPNKTLLFEHLFGGWIGLIQN